MNAEQFVYWLNGYLELSGAQEMSSEQLKCIREHIALVMRKVTPPLEDPNPGHFGGVRCGVCQNWTSNEGGLCNKHKETAAASGVLMSAGGKEEDLAAESVEARANSSWAEMPIVDVPCFLTC